MTPEAREARAVGVRLLLAIVVPIYCIVGYALLTRGVPFLHAVFAMCLVVLATIAIDRARRTWNEGEDR